MIRLRRKTSFTELGYWFGVGKASAHEYFKEMLALFNVTVAPVLLRVPSVQEMLDVRSPEAALAFKIACLIYDGTNFVIGKPEIFALNRLTWSTYKKFNSFQVMLSESHSVYQLFSVVFSPSLCRF